MEHTISGLLSGEKESAVVSATAEEIRRKTLIDRRTNTALWDLVSYQQETFQRLMSTTLNAYMNFLRLPFSFSQTEVNATEAATEQVTQHTEHAAQQATKAATQEVKQLAEHLTQQAIEAATEQVKQLAEHAAQQATKAAGTQAQRQREQT